MIFVYFAIICVVLFLISWFIIPFIEKNEKLTNAIKNIVDVIEDIILGIFMFYSFCAIVLMTTKVINEWLNVDNGGILAFIIVVVLGYRLIKKFNDE